MRLHLCQFDYNPAYYESPSDFLEEPSFSADLSDIGKLRHISAINKFLTDSKISYLKHIRTKIRDIIDWSGNRYADIVLLPEYSVPLQLLPDIQPLAKHYSMVIVAGTHRISHHQYAKDVYEQLGIPLQDLPNGASCAPVFLHDGSTKIAFKSKKSKWEPNLSIAKSAPEVIKLEDKNRRIKFSVIPCIDSLHPDVIGKLWADGKPQPNIVLCPSLSPTTEHFDISGTMLASNEVVFGFANAAQYGDTFINIPTQWETYLEGISPRFGKVPKLNEAILEIDVDHEHFYAKKGSVENRPVSSHPRCFPLVYPKNVSWLQKYDSMKRGMLKQLDETNEYEPEKLESFLVNTADDLPDIVRENLKHIKHAILPFYDGNLESVKNQTIIIKISNHLESTRYFWAKRVSSAISMLTEYFPKADVSDSETILKTLSQLKHQQQSLPRLKAHPDEDVEAATASMKRELSHVGETNLIESFQNRGGDLDAIRNLFSNEQIRVIVITGAIGIGKTDFLNWMLRKQFGDWEPIRIQIPNDGKVPRIIAEIGYKVGVPLDLDSLSSAHKNVYRQSVSKVLTQFYSKPKRALVIDDLHQIFRFGNLKDHQQLSWFLKMATSQKRYVGGRIFLVSSQWVPEKWLNFSGVGHHRLKAIRDRFVKRIIEYQMRKLNLIEDEGIPTVPQDLLDIIRGHPLSAKLVAEALREQAAETLTDELSLTRISGYVAKELLRHFQLNETEQALLRELSFFRLPIEKEILNIAPHFRDRVSQLMDLADRCIISFDGRSFEMHEAIRRFFYSQALAVESPQHFHSIAGEYYLHLYDEQKYEPQKDPAIIAELIHHLTLSEDLSKVDDLRLFVISEIKPAARRLYKEYRDWVRALSIYRLLAEMVPDDIEVLAYLGRCYARLFQWEDSDAAFKKAIKLSEKMKKPVWWIYRDWGHIRARYNHYEIAAELFDQASAFQPEDVSIIAAKAFMKWKEGFHQDAKDLFERALAINPYHEYTLTYYPKFLDQIGDLDLARELRKRLEELETETEYRIPVEYDIEVEFDD